MKKLVIIIFALTIFNSKASNIMPIKDIFGKVKKIEVNSYNNNIYSTTSELSKAFNRKEIPQKNTYIINGQGLIIKFLPGSFFFLVEQNGFEKTGQMSIPVINFKSKLLVPLYEFLRCIDSLELYTVNLNSELISINSIIKGNIKEENSISRKLKYPDSKNIDKIIEKVKTDLNDIENQLMSEELDDEETSDIENRLSELKSLLNEIYQKTNETDKLKNQPEKFKKSKTISKRQLSVNKTKKKSKFNETIKINTEVDLPPKEYYSIPKDLKRDNLK